MRRQYYGIQFSFWRFLVTAVGLGEINNMKSSKFAAVLYLLWFIFIMLVAAANIFSRGSIIY